MPKYMISYTIFFLLLTAISGVWMRLFPFWGKIQSVPYDHILHAHSHGAVLGWLFLASFIIFLSLSWNEIPNKKHVNTMFIVTVFVTGLMFIAFIYEGYAKFSIIFSTSHIFIEYWVAIYIFIFMKKRNMMPKISRYFINAGLLTLIISSIGPFSLGGLAASGLKDTPFFDMAIYFYLHFQYNGWLYLMLVGLFIWFLNKKQVPLNGKWLRMSFWIYFVALFPGFFLSILWYDFSTTITVLAMFGGIGQFIGVVIFIIALWKALLKKNPFVKWIYRLVVLALTILLSKGLMELALIYPPLAAIVYDTRSVVIGYLHLTLLGFLTIFVFILFGLVGVVSFRRKFTVISMVVFLIGFVINEITLFVSGLMNWIGKNNIIFHHQLLLIASVILLISIGMIWYSAMTNKKDELPN